MKKILFITCAVLLAFGLSAFGFRNWNQPTPCNTTPSCKAAPACKAALGCKAAPDSKAAPGCKAAPSCKKVLACKAAPVSAKPTPPQSDLVNPIFSQLLPELVYNVDSRFIANITRENLRKAKKVTEIFPPESTRDIDSYREVKVAILHGKEETVALGENEQLNPNQIRLLQTADYSTDFYLRALCKWKNPETGSLDLRELVYYFTIIPEKEAEFKSGYDELISYLKTNTREQTARLDRDKLQPGRVGFTVTQTGAIKGAEISSSSGFSEVDETLVKLISGMSGQWNPAQNALGEPIEQKLYFFFGMMGC
ncbi:MAG: energy transducer TonB [Bacteroidia bacterium]|nr:energy transducer TonB [Bacteroidia bacterium]